MCLLLCDCRALLDTCRLFLSDHPSSVEPLHSGIQHRHCTHTAADWCLSFAGPCTTKGAVCVAEAGSLDLLLTMRSEEMAGSSDDKKLPRLEVEFCGGQVHLMTCADSFVALRDIVLCLALDGASEISGSAEDAEQQGTPPSVSGRVLCAVLSGKSAGVPLCCTVFSPLACLCACVSTVLVIQCPSSVAADKRHRSLERGND